MSDKISVIVPIYNVEPCIRQCLDSIINQTYRDLQIILVDDGTPDRCGEIADEYAKKDDRIVVVHKKNAGVSAARNDGINMATGEWISFVDPDDWIDLDYYEKILHAFPAYRPDIMIMSGCIYEYTWGSDTVQFYADEKEFAEKCQDKNYLIQKLFSSRFGHDDYFPNGTFGTPWSRLFRTKLLREKIIRFPLGIHPMEDMLFNMHAFLEAAFVVPCECVGYHYRQQRQQSSVNRINPQWPTMVECIMAELKCLLSKEELYGKYKDAVNAFTIGCLDAILRNDCFHPDNHASYIQIVQQIKELKEKEYFSLAIWTKGISYLGKRVFVVKYLMRLPFVWPLMLFYRFYYLRRRVLDRYHLHLNKH